MTEPAINSTSPDSGGDTNYITVALVVGIPCSIVIVVLVALISAMAYLTIRSSRGEQQEETYMRRRFQGLSLEQQRKMKKKRKKRVVGRRESAISGTFNTSVSRTPSSVSAAAWKNPFGLQEWQIRMYSDGGEGEGSPDTEETELSGDEATQRRRRGHPMGAINPLMIQNQVHDPGYDTPPHSRHRPHPQAPPTQTQTRPAASSASARQSGRSLRQKQTEYDEQDSSSEDSMNPYDEY